MSAAYDLSETLWPDCALFPPLILRNMADLETARPAGREIVVADIRVDLTQFEYDPKFFVKQFLELAITVPECVFFEKSMLLRSVSMCHRIRPSTF